MRLPVLQAPALSDRSVAASQGTIAAGVGGAMSGLIVAFARPDALALAVMIGAWIGVSAVLLSGCAARERCGPFEMSLPVSAREIWRSHAVARALSAARVVVAGLLVVVPLVVGLHVALGPEFAVYRELAWITLSLACGIVLAVPLLESRDRRHARRPDGVLSRLADAVVLATVLVLLLLVHVLAGPGWPVLLAVAGLGLGAWIDRALPPTFLLFPTATPAKTFALLDAFARRPDRGPRSTPAWITAWRATRGAHPVLIATNALWMGFIVGDGLTFMAGELSRTFLLVPFSMLTIQQVMAITPYGMAALYRYDHLPLSRRMLFAALMVPILSLALLGFGAGRAVSFRADHVFEAVNLALRDGRFQVDIPERMHEISWEGAVPSFTAPWGESAPATVRRLSRDGDIVAYAPFGITPESSPEFVALQISRAARFVYGIDVDPEVIADGHLRTNEHGTVVPIKLLSFAAESPGLRPPPRGPLTPYLLVVVLPLGLLMMGLLLRFQRPGTPDRIKITFFWLGSAALAIIGFGVWTVTFASPLTLTGTITLVEIHSYRFGQNGWAVGASWLLGIALTLLAYRFAESQFHRVEFERRPLSFWLLRPRHRLDA